MSAPRWPAQFRIHARNLGARLFGAGLQSGIGLLGICGIALIWFGISHSLDAQRQAALAGAYQNAANLARAFDEAIVRSINSVDQSLLHVRQVYAKHPEDFSVTEWIRNTRVVSGVSLQLSIIDKDGMLVQSSLTPPGTRMDLSDRAHFRAQRDQPGDELVMSQPLKLRANNAWSIQFNRKLIAPDGSFDGVVEVSLDPRLLTQYYKSFDLGRKGIVVLLGEDGIFRGRAGGVDQLNDEVIGRQAINSPILEHYATAHEGTFTLAAAVDGTVRAYAYRGVRGFPLVLAVGFAEDEVLETYYENRRGYLMLGAIVTALLVTITAVLLVRQTQMQRAREKLRADFEKKSEFLKKTLESMNQGIVLVDGDGNVQVRNQRLVDMLDLPEALIKRTSRAGDVLRWLWENIQGSGQGRDFETWRAEFMRMPSAPERVLVIEYNWKNEKIFEIRTELLSDGGHLRTYTDITERRRYETMLLTARDEARAAARAKSEFLATMSHEIRSPMSGLMGILELLRARGLDGETGRMADMAHDSAAMLLAVLNDILDFSRIEAGALTITPEPTNPRGLLERLVAPQIVAARHKGVDVSLCVAADVPDWVMTDGLRLRQILGNLLSNAVKFTASGKVTLTATRAPDGDGPTLCYTVSDTGIGMSPDVLARLFQPFMQADGSITRRFGGTGLGLCISHQLANLLGGTLSVTSTEGQGSEFILRLPCAPCAPAGRTAEHPAAEMTPVPGKRGRALVVDDDSTNRWLAQRQLTQLGFDVETADDGQDGLDAVIAAPFDLLVTDCHMPRMDGASLTEAVRRMADPKRREMPIIGLTADATAAQRERCARAGMNDLAHKPLTMARLSALVARVLTPNAPPSTPDAVAPELHAIDFDTQIFLEMFSPGDPEGRAWLDEFLAAATDDVDELTRLVPDDAAIGTVVKIGHRLAGAAFSVGAMLLGEAARALERAAMAPAPENLAVLLDAVRMRLDDARAAISVFAADGAPRPVLVD